MPGKHVPVDRLDDALRQHPTWNAPAGFSRQSWRGLPASCVTTECWWSSAPRCLPCTRRPSHGAARRSPSRSPRLPPGARSGDGITAVRVALRPAIRTGCLYRRALDECGAADQTRAQSASRRPRTGACTGSRCRTPPARPAAALLHRRPASASCGQGIRAQSTWRRSLTD